MSIDTVESRNVILISDIRTPAEIYSDRTIIDKLIEEIHQKATQHTPDVSTKRGRDEIASVAYKVARTKTALDDMGKSLVAEEKAKIAKIDAERKRIRDSLDSLKDEVRRPLDEWEQAEKLRIEKIDRNLNRIKVLANGIQMLLSYDHVDSTMAEIRDIFETTEWDEKKEQSAIAFENAQSLADQRYEWIVAIETQRVKEAEERRKAQAELEAERAKIAKERARLAEEREAAEALIAEDRRKAQAKEDENTQHSESARVADEPVFQATTIDSAPSIDTDKVAEVVELVIENASAMSKAIVDGFCGIRSVEAFADFLEETSKKLRATTR